MRQFTNYKFRLNRLLSEGSLYKQIAWLSFATAFVYLFFVFLTMLLSITLDIQLCDSGGNSSLWSVLYFFVDAGNQAGLVVSDNSSTAVSYVERILAFIISLFGAVFFGGLLISTLSNVIQRRVDDCRNGLVTYDLCNHFVVIGNDEMLIGIINRLTEKDSHAMIAVLISGDVSEVDNCRQRVSAGLIHKEADKRLIFYYGTRTSKEDLEKLCITKAQEVYILGSAQEKDAVESVHDSLNVRCMELIATLCKEQRTQLHRLPCHVSFEYQATYYIYQYADLGKEIADYIEFLPFNFFELWAQKVLISRQAIGVEHLEPIIYPPLDRKPITHCEQNVGVHFVIIGLSRMGEALAMLAAHSAHYPNYKLRKTQLTLIDANMENIMPVFKQKCGELFAVCRSTYINTKDCDSLEEAMAKAKISDISPRYAHLVEEHDAHSILDIEWTFVNGMDAHPVVRELLENIATKANTMVTVAVCLNVTHLSLQSATHLPAVYYEMGEEIPILVQQRQTTSIVNMLSGTLDGKKNTALRYRNLVPFGMTNYMESLNNEYIRSLAKSINYYYSAYFGCDKGKTADELWDEVAITAERWSNIYAACSIPIKIRCFPPPFSDEQVEMLTEMEQNRWNVEKLLLGYRPYTLKDEQEVVDKPALIKEKKKMSRIHKDIRPFNQVEKNSIKITRDMILHIPSILKE